ncbi:MULTISPECIES: ABC transporter substrate-binding protein [Rhizobium]|uniref:ABC transporter substrate-binding protein n=3 Tax=Rhizobium TaxID=379 RepID=A0ABY8IQP9_9HYPH|nr:MULTISPECIES: ABC transporter substrate-binding protein [Rhizobium]MBO9134852.1 ABC transporter substrate-binding protein [Rhizobium sp. B209b/85]MBZ5787029.1 ABC transporter substrate-binding protein [Rhizobium sp. VS19-DR121]QXZ86730.1 ABC transporter substrate-binding protein [Rhizobium sp. K1/93]QXZ88236.1 ABC transporter substrate-binding protein [Rhizobium sp. K1/93]QXZ98213.1 ABC transporter substrate-binding protein [Rhizobium sp. B230/85]
MKRRTFLIGTTGAIFGASLNGIPSAMAQDAKPEKTDVSIGVGGKPLLYYLPLTIAERKGFFKEEGLNVTINDFSGGSKSLEGLVGGSLDIVAGAYEHTIRMQTKGQDIVGICNLGRFPGIVIAVRKDLAGEIKSMADMKGRKVGITAPGSSTALMFQYAMLKSGLKADDASLIGIGGGAAALAAFKSGQIDALSHVDPVIAQLQYDNDIAILLDTRTEAGTRSLFGGPNPAATVYIKKEFTVANPVTTQRTVNAFMKALKWIGQASPEDVASVVPTEYQLGNRDLYMQAFKNSKEMYSLDGLVTKEGYDSMMGVLKTLDPGLANADVPFSKTFDPTFAKAAKT